MYLHIIIYNKTLRQYYVTNFYSGQFAIAKKIKSYKCNDIYDNLIRRSCKLVMRKKYYDFSLSYTHTHTHTRGHTYRMSKFLVYTNRLSFGK